jgi:chemotaxis signal transduction protein
MAVYSPARRPPQHLTFRVGMEEYALNAARVREILPYRDVAPAGQAPPWIRGSLSVRGLVVPVVDLALKLGAAPAVVTRSTCTLLVDALLAGGPVTIGLVVDAVGQAVELADEDVEPAPSFGTGVDVGFLQGIGRVRDRLLLVLDVDRVLSSTDCELLEELLALSPDVEPPQGGTATTVGAE